MQEIEVLISWMKAQKKSLEETILGGLTSEGAYQVAVQKLQVYNDCIEKAREIADHDFGEMQ
jgi:hypothetical protein